MDGPADVDDELTARLRAAGCVFAEDEARLLRAAAPTEPQLELLVRRRLAGEPLEHVTGRAWFADEEVHVGPGVFVPRARSELLVARVLAHLARRAVDAGRLPTVVELCCGTGAIGLAIARAHAVELHAVDIDRRATSCAASNLEGLGTVHTGDLFSPLPPRMHGLVDVVVANAPYVPSGELHLLPRDAREHEAGIALDGGADGLDVVRRIAGELHDWLAPGGLVCVETSAAQATIACGILEAAGIAATVTRDEELDATVVAGIRAVIG